jgi:hypothetical protein
MLLSRGVAVAPIVIMENTTFELTDLGTRVVYIGGMDDDKTGIVSVYNIFLDGVDVVFRYADIGRIGDDWTTISANNNEQKTLEFLCNQGPTLVAI